MEKSLDQFVELHAAEFEPCPELDNETLIRFYLNDLEGRFREPIINHIFECPRCADFVRGLELFFEEVEMS